MSLLCVMHCVEHPRALFNLTLQSAYEAGSVVVYGLSCVRHFVTPWTGVHQAPVSVEFSRQEYCSGLPFPPLGNLPDPEIRPSSLASPALTGRQILYHWTTWEALDISIPLLLSCFIITGLWIQSSPFYYRAWIMVRVIYEPSTVSNP